MEIVTLRNMTLAPVVQYLEPPSMLAILGGAPMGHVMSSTIRYYLPHLGKPNLTKTLEGTLG